MPTTTDLSAALRETFGLSDARTASLLRRLQETGEMPNGSRGHSAIEITPAHAAAFLLTVMVGERPREAKKAKG